jgi:hypothetical protein
MNVLKTNSSNDESDDEYDKPMIKYESSFIKSMILPQDPRLFCLLYNGTTVEYDNNEDVEDKINNCERD